MTERVITGQQAFEDGKADRIGGKPRGIIPKGYRNAPGLAKAWRKGWESVIITPEPQITVQQPNIITMESFWPKDKPLPVVYHKPRPVPCPKCLRTTLQYGAQAVVVSTTSDQMAYMMCRGPGCNHRFKMRIE